MHLLNFDDGSLFFFLAFLSDRFFLTHGADPQACSGDVDQGPGPGGNLFCAFINFMIRVFINSQALVFVGDAQAYIHSKIQDVNISIGKINEDSASLANWAAENGLKLNAARTQAIIFGSPSNLRKLNELIENDLVADIIVDGVKILLSAEVTNAGIKMTNDLS